MNNNDERDFAEEAYNAAEYRREYEAEVQAEKERTRKVVHLSDTSHPFTSYEHNPRILHFSAEERKALESLEGEKSDHLPTLDETLNNWDKSDDGIRILSTQEHEAIRTFASKWGFSHNERITDDLVGMLEDTTSVQEMLISRFMRNWDLNGASYDGVELDLINLFDLRETDKQNKPDEQEETFRELRKAYFREEADQRVNRYFVGQSGWVWVVHYIVDMPEQYDASRPSSALYRAKDGMTTLHMTSLHMTQESAWDAVNADIRLVLDIEPDVPIHVVELDTM